MKKRIMIIMFVIVITTLNINAYTDEYPSWAPISGGTYIEVQTSQLGRVIIYVPVDFKDNYISVYKGTNTPLNIGNSTITCQAYTTSGVSYQVRFTRLNSAEYYNNYSGSNWRWDSLNITNIYNTNLKITDNESSSALRQISTSEIMPYVITIILLLQLLITIRRGVKE